jgi:transposase
LILTFRHRFRRLTCLDCGASVRARFEQKTRRWRHLSLWGLPTYLEGPIRRLRCPSCQSVRTERVPWARPGSDFTAPFEDVVGLLAQRLKKTAVAELTGVAWVTVGRIAERLVAEKLDERRFEGLRRIGVDEIAYRRHHKYLTVVVNHDTGNVVWAAEGKSSETLAPSSVSRGPSGWAPPRSSPWICRRPTRRPSRRPCPMPPSSSTSSASPSSLRRPWTRCGESWCGKFLPTSARP